MNRLYYGDNLLILRDHIRDESVDLIYLDPPFNSNASYNVLFKAPTGEQSQAQIEAFDDTWHWTSEGAESAFDEVIQSGNTEAANMLRAIRSFLGENDTMAYLAMMAVRLIELHRVPESLSNQCTCLKLSEEELAQKTTTIKGGVYTILFAQLGSTILNALPSRAGCECFLNARNTLPSPAPEQVLRYEMRGILLKEAGVCTT
jgi:hypothetical protein